MLSEYTAVHTLFRFATKHAYDERTDIQNFDHLAQVSGGKTRDAEWI